jgi:sec-independent protein translocase protein TatA
VLKNLGPIHVIILLAVVILIFGAKRLPDVAQSVGQSLKIFKNEVKDLRTDDAKTADAEPGTQPVVQTTVVTPPVVVKTPVAPVPDPPEPTEGSAPPKA